MTKSNKVYNEDCLTTMNRMDAESVELVFTSPLYYNAKDYSQYNSLHQYMGTMMKIFSSVFTVLKKSRMCVINISPVLVPRKSRQEQSYRIPLPFYFVPMMEDIGFEFLEDIIWVKPEGSAKNRNGGFYQHRKPVAYKPNIVTENILVFKKPAPFLIDKVVRGYSGNALEESLVEDGYERSNVWMINPETKSKHPAPFPEGLAKRIIGYYSFVGDLVYDPFMGSGTTAKVSKEMKRSWIGSEMSEEYCTMTEERVKN